MDKISPPRKTLWRLPATALSFALLSAPLAFSQLDDEEDEVFELSPFTVNAANDTGYRATSTLAGTRIATDLKDVGSAIQVVTAEFLKDTGATNVEELLSYTTGTEAGGASGNYAGSGAAAGDVNQNNEVGRANPVANTRVRGLSSASTTRDYFLSPSWIGFDSYNTETVTISRGPNSILFGIGEPGGVIDNSAKKARLSKDSNQVSLRFGSFGTYRTTIDLNRVLVEDRLAIRLNAMHENVKYRQDPAFEKDTRFHATITAKLFKNENVEWLGATEFEASYETATVEGTPPDTMPIFDTFSHWWNAPGSQEIYELTGKKPEGWWPGDWNQWQSQYASQWIEDPVGGTTPAGLRRRSQPSMWGAYSIVFDGADGAVDLGYDSGKFADVGVIHATSGALINSEGLQTPGWNPLWIPHQNGPLGDYNNFGFKRQVVMDKNIFNWEEMLIQGNAQYVNHGYDSNTITLRQGFMNNKAGIELAIDDQTYGNERFFPMGRHIYSSVKIDNSKYLTNGELNPNVGRPFFAGVYDPTKHFKNTYETQRATAYYELDFTEQDGVGRHFGKHTFTGLLSSWEKNEQGYSNLWSWNTDDDPNQTYKPGDPAGWGGQAFFHAYIGPSNIGVSDPSGLQLYQRPMDIMVPVEGQQFTNYYFENNGSAATNEIRTGTVTVDRHPKWPGAKRQTVDSEGITLQSKWLDSHLVTTYGWRKDAAKSWDITAVDSGLVTKDGQSISSADLEASWDNWNNGTAQTRGNGPSTLPWRDGPLPVLDQEGETTTVQGVLHVPSKWTEGLPLSPMVSMHYSESENFNPASVRRDIFNDVIGSPSGETTEKGFSIDMAESKVNLRFNWYETSSKNVNNTNISGSLWAFQWPKNWADRWMQAKNAYQKALENGDADAEDRSFANSGWGSYDNPNAVFYDGATGPFNSYDEAINFFLYDTMPASTVAALNPRITGEIGDQKIETDSILGLSSVADVVSEGFEIEATLNPTKNWRISFNASKTESVFDNGLGELFRYVDEVSANVGAFGDQVWDMYEGGRVHSNVIRGRWLEATNPLASAATKNGTVSTELRKWRWNMVTNYNFSDGRFKGLGVGGSLRWQDDVSLGYPIMQDEVGNFVPVLSQPFMGGQDIRGDVWISFRTKMGEGKLPVKFQVNLQNFIGDDDPIPVAINPDGQLAIVRSAPEKKVMFTTTIDF